MERLSMRWEYRIVFLCFRPKDMGWKEPWHGYIKVREELKWLQQYDGK